MKNLGFMGFDKYAVTRDGEVFSFYSSKFLKKNLKKDGYFSVRLYSDSQETPKDFRVHRLVAMAFLGVPEDESLQVNHKDGDKKNNSVKNLEWVTGSENTIHSYVNKLQKTNRGFDIADIEVVHAICKYLEEGFRQKQVAEMLGVTERLVNDIKNHHRWVHVSEEYDFTNVERLSRLSVDKIMRICSDLEKGFSCSSTARRNKVGTSTVHRIYRRKTHTSISKNFSWE